MTVSLRFSTALLVLVAAILAIGGACNTTVPPQDDGIDTTDETDGTDGSDATDRLGDQGREDKKTRSDESRHD